MPPRALRERSRWCASVSARWFLPGSGLASWAGSQNRLAHNGDPGPHLHGVYYLNTSAGAKAALARYRRQR